MDKFSTAVLSSTEQQQSTITINGVPQGSQKVRVYFVACSNCNRLLAQFNPGEQVIGVLQYYKNRLATDMIFCPTCGCKLNYTADILEANCTELHGD